MKTVSLSGSLRENVGKKDAKKHRKEGKVPCVLYGGKEQTHFIADEKDFQKIIFTPEVYIINLTIAGKETSAILQDVQYHPVSDSILHVDFLEVIPGKPVSIAVPLRLQGSSPGVIKGGRLTQKIKKIRVKALVEDLPDQVVIDISKLDIGDKIKVAEVKEEKLSFLDNPNSIIVGVYTARTVVAGAGEDDEDEDGEEGGETPAEGGDAPAAE